MSYTLNHDHTTTHTGWSVAPSPCRSVSLRSLCVLSLSLSLVPSSRPPLSLVSSSRPPLSHLHAVEVERHMLVVVEVNTVRVPFYLKALNHSRIPLPYDEGTAADGGVPTMEGR